MKLNILVILVSLMYSLNVKAQIFQTDLNKKNITSVSFKLANSSITVIGSEADSLTITVIGNKDTNMKDSSGLGLKLTTTGHTLALEKTTSKDVTYLVKLPKYISLSVEETHLDKPQMLKVENMQGDVNVISWMSTIKLNNNTGSVTASSFVSDIFAILPTNINRPCSFVSHGRLVDLTINRKSKIVLEAKVMRPFTTNFKLSTPFEITRSGFFQTVKGSMNGGGAMVKVESHTLVLKE